MALLGSLRIKKMNDLINKFLFAEDKFIPEIHSRQLKLTYSVRGPFTKNKERIKSFKEKRRFKIQLLKQAR